MTTTSPSGLVAPTRHRPRRGWAGYAGFAWSLAYLLLGHLPLLLTGRPLLPYPVNPAGEPPREQQIVVEAGVCLLLLGTALTSLALVRPWGRLFSRWMLLGVGWVGTTIGLLHWVIWTWQSLQRMTGASVVPAPDGVSEQAWAEFIWEYDLVNVLLYEPWFLGMGLFLGIAAVQNIRRWRSDAGSGVAPRPPRWLTSRGWSGYALPVWAVLGAAAQLSWAAGGTFGQNLGLPVLDGHAELLSAIRPGFLGLGILAALAVPLGPALLSGRRGWWLRSARVLSGVFLLGGLVVVLLGIMSYDPWIFAAYGPALMAGGILLELTAWCQPAYSGSWFGPARKRDSSPSR